MSLLKALSVDRNAKTSVFTPEQWAVPWSGSVGLYDGTFSDYLSIYRAQPAVRQVISFIAENIGQVPMKVYKRVGEDERKPQPNHILQQTLLLPNPESSQYEFTRDLVTDLEIFDCTFWQIARVGGEEHLFRLFPDAVELRDINQLGPQTFRYYDSKGNFKDLDRSSVLYLHGYGSAKGISQMETLKRVLQEDFAAGQWREGMYRTGMRNAGVITRPLDAPDWSNDARERFIEQILARHTGPNGANRPLLLEEGMGWQNDQQSTRSEEYIAGREFTVRAVANAFRISPAILGLADAPYASITEYNKQLYQNALASRLTFITQGIERQMLSRQERASQKIYVEFNLDAKLRGSFMERAAIAQIAVGSPYMTVNEWRALENLTPVDGGDELGGPAVSPGPNAQEGLVDQPAPSEDTPQPEPDKAGFKERGGISRRNKYAGEIYEVLGSTMERVVKAHEAKSAGNKSQRWQREVKSDLKPIMHSIVTREGTRKFADFDPKRTENYLDKGADLASKNIADKVDESIARHPDSPDLLKTSLLGIAARVAEGQASHLMGFARVEAAKQGGFTRKTWSVTSAKSRHPELDGETVPTGALFSNGLAYPGDPSGGVDENANCHCILDLS